MIRLPTDQQNRWRQPNTSDKFGTLWYTKNINLDEEGYIKLSPRTLTILDEDTSGNFGVPLAIGRFDAGNYLIATTSDANYNLALATNTITATENSGSNEPTLTTASHAIFWQNTWLASTATAVLSRAVSISGSAAWTSRITGLTSGKRHHMAVFGSRNELCVTNGNVIKQYDTSYSGTTDLTIPSDFEAIGLAYNNSRMGIITKLGTSTAGQSREARFYLWDGSTTAANTDAALGTHAAVAICAYQSSFAVLTQAGQLLYWNGGGFDQIAAFPLYFDDKIWGDILNIIGYGDLMTADGDVIYLNLPFQLSDFGRKQEQMLVNLPSGVWCFDPKVGLYHRWSGSISQAHLLTESSVNTSTNVITISAGTIPATGNPVRYTTANTAIGGLTLNQDYYIIKESSSEFKLATTKENALFGTAIDLTSAGSTSFFWAYDLVDYGTTYHGDSGGITLVGENNTLYRDVIFGADYGDTSLATNDAVCIAVPFLENRGYFVTPKIFSSGVTDSHQKLFVKFRPLKTNDAIVIKKRIEDVSGLPVSTTADGKEATWTSPSELYTTQDLSEAQTYLEAEGHIEIEILSGAGGGTTAKVTDIDNDGTTYSLVLEEPVLGAAASRKCHFMLHNWEHLHTITDDSENPLHLSLEGSGKFIQFKIELRGTNTTIEELQFVNDIHQLAQ